MPFGSAYHLPDLLLAGSAVIVQQERIKAEIVLYRIEASGKSRVLDRVNKYPVESHSSGPLEMISPFGKLPRDKGKEVVDYHLPGFFVSPHFTSFFRFSRFRAWHRHAPTAYCLPPTSCFLFPLFPLLPL